MHSVHSFRSLSLVLVLAFLLSAPYPVQAGSSESPGAKNVAAPIGLLVEWFDALLGDNGCTFDPSGSCLDSAGGESPSVTDNLDNGCTFDPSGSSCRDSR